MKKYLLSIAIIFFLSIEIKAHVDHYSKYNYLEYELFRNNKLIGYHKYNFKRDKFEIKKAQQIFGFSILYLFLIFVLFLVDKLI